MLLDKPTINEEDDFLSRVYDDFLVDNNNLPDFNQMQHQEPLEKEVSISLGRGIMQDDNLPSDNIKTMVS